jgi:hypothetical protein
LPLPRSAKIRPSIPLQLPEMIFRFINDNALQGKGIDWVYAAIPRSVRETGMLLATFDKTLESTAKEHRLPRLPGG